MPQATLDRIVVPVVLSGDVGAIGEASGGADLAFDMMGGSKTADPTVACIRGLKSHGTAVLMGGVHADLTLPYLHVMLARMVASGTLDLG